MKAIDNLRKAARKGVHLHTKFASECQKYVVYIEQSEFDDMIDAVERELEEEYVSLPKDADGVPIHIGDKLVGKYLEGNPVVECTRLTLTNDWMVGHGRQDGTANLFAHYKPPTVEDVLREFAKSIAEVLGGDDFLLRDDDEMYAEFAERLQLRGENDG